MTNYTLYDVFGPADEESETAKAMLKLMAGLEAKGFYITEIHYAKRLPKRPEATVWGVPFIFDNNM
jgi:hypothetical protein